MSLNNRLGSALERTNSTPVMSGLKKCIPSTEALLGLGLAAAVVIAAICIFGEEDEDEQKTEQ